MYEEEFDYNKPFSPAIWARMLPFVQPYRKEMLIITLTMLLTAAIDVAYPIALSIAVDQFILPASYQGLPLFIAVVAALGIIQGLCVLVFIRLAIRVEIGVGKSLRRQVFHHLQTLSFSYYNVTPVGYMMARVMSDTTKIGELIGWGLVDMMWSAAYVAGVLIAMLILNWKLALIIMVIIPILSLVTAYFQNRILKINREVRRLNSRVTGGFNEGITGARTTKTLGIEQANLSGFAHLTGQMYSRASKMAFLNSVFLPLLLFIGSIATAAILSYGGFQVIAGTGLLLGTLAAFINYSLNIFEPVQQVARVLSEFVSTQANIERVTGMLDLQPQVIDSPEVLERYGDMFEAKTENWEPLGGDIEFENVTFRYPDGGENVLENFSLTVNKNTYVALVGETGAGKSTLVNLVCRFFEPTGGRVLIDGRDYKERSQLWLHSNIGYVLQSPHLFSGTVRENIRYGRLTATDAEVEEAARLVSADRVIAKLEQGMDTDVGEGGDRLSTGEKQLISFARAVLADPRIFVLDEATSSVDTETEHLIQRATAHMLRGRTSFVIAHRLSTIRSADIILVVRDGKIIEQGTHRQLISKRGYYHELYTRQLEDEIKAEALA